MNPKGKPPESTRDETSAKVRDEAVQKLEAKGNDTAKDTAVGPSLQRALRENA